MKRVGIYVRVSTVEQADKGWSIEGQYRDIRAFCEKQEDWKVACIFKQGQSAKVAEMTKGAFPAPSSRTDRT